MTNEWANAKQRGYRAGRLEALHEDALRTWGRYVAFVKVLRQLGELPAKPVKK